MRIEVRAMAEPPKRRIGAPYWRALLTTGVKTTANSAALGRVLYGLMITLPWRARPDEIVAGKIGVRTEAVDRP